MQRITRIIAVGAIGLLGATAAQASVVYNFIPNENTGGQYISVSDGYLEVTDAAYRAGSLSVDYTGAYNSTFPTFDSPVIDASISWMPGGNALAGGVQVTPGSARFVDYQLEFSAELSFLDYGGLSGNLYLRDTENTARAVGQGDSWDVLDVGSDRFSGLAYCNEGTGPMGVPADPCYAGMGHWELDASTVPTESDSADVSEPSTWALFGAALLGMIGLRAQRRGTA